MKNLHAIATAALLVTPTLLMPSIINAQVKSMSTDKFQNVDGERYWEVAVKCEGQADEVTMKRNVGGDNLWCSASNAKLCDKNKVTLSRKICASTAKPVAKAKKPTEKSKATPAKQNASLDSAAAKKEAARTELLREQVQIEEQRILLEQKRLRLVQTELSLKKQKEN